MNPRFIAWSVVAILVATALLVKSRVNGSLRESNVSAEEEFLGV